MLMFNAFPIQDIAAWLAAGAVLLAGSGWMVSAMLDSKIKKLDCRYMKIGDCIVRDTATRERIQITQDEARAACVAAAERDMATQERIDDLVQSAASRMAEAAAAVMRDKEILGKIDALLARGK